MALRRHAEKTAGRIAMTSRSLNVWGGFRPPVGKPPDSERWFRSSIRD